MCLKVNYIIYQTVCTKIQYSKYEDLKPDCEGIDKKKKCKIKCFKSKTIIDNNFDKKIGLIYVHY